MKTLGKKIGLKTLGLYLHIPFCVKKCLYCDFLSFDYLGETEQRDYCDSLIREIENAGLVTGNEYMVDTIFIGGGTPSLINEALTVDIMSAVRANFKVMPDAEITMESNPKTLTETKLAAYLGAGINRLSMGVQSLNDNCLGQLGRIHNREDFLKNYQMARIAGFKNISLDLMFAIPGQNMEIWVETLQEAMDLEPAHISFYSLQIEEGTPFYDFFKQGKLSQTGDEVDREMYHGAMGRLKEAGYHHYEISNAAKPGFESRHNLKYWSFEDYLGIGLGAHSFLNGNRFSNTKNLDIYREKLNAGESPEAWRHENTRKDSISEYVFTGLRKTGGLDLQNFSQRFDTTLQEYYQKEWPNINKYICDKYLFIDENNLKITEKGLDIANRILTEFV